jgi:hypothetical protein
MKIEPSVTSLLEMISMLMPNRLCRCNNILLFNIETESNTFQKEKRLLFRQYPPRGTRKASDYVN